MLRQQVRATRSVDAELSTPLRESNLCRRS